MQWTLLHKPMMPFNNRIQYFNSRLCQWRNLLFFLVLMGSGCEERTITVHQESITAEEDAGPDIANVNWENDKAVSVSMPAQWIDGVPKNAIAKNVQVRLLQHDNKLPVMGSFTLDNQLVFQPLVPFTRDNFYGIFVHDQLVGQFHVAAANGSPTQVIAVYPQVDTVPENMLKIYIQFSRPMSEGQSAKYISLVKNDTDTLHDVFLDLQPELWNEFRTALTLWLDPGRIKRDLQPNLKLGNPLHTKEKYRLIISKNWKDVQGRALQNSYEWNFVTGARDSLSPDPGKWTVTLPKAGTRRPVMINFHETLDHFLAIEPITLTITYDNGRMVSGSMEVIGNDRFFKFLPDQPWSAGNYVLKIKSRLEDLAGNNLNRPFDRDVTKTKEPANKEYHFKNFTITK